METDGLNWEQLQNLMNKIYTHAKSLSFVKESKTFTCVRQVLIFWEGRCNCAMLSVKKDEK